MFCYHSWAKSKYLQSIQPLLQPMPVKSPALSSLPSPGRRSHGNLQSVSEKWHYSESDWETTSSSFLNYQESKKQNATSLSKLFVPHTPSKGTCLLTILLLTSKQLGSHAAAIYEITSFFRSHPPLVCSSTRSQFGKCWGSSNVYETAGITFTSLERLRHKHSKGLSVLIVNVVNLEIPTILI